VSGLIADRELGRRGQRGYGQQAPGKHRDGKQERERVAAQLSKGVGPSGCSCGREPRNSTTGEATASNIMDS